jgi:hypothetical protein
MAVPCCQKELRPQLGVPHADQPFLKHDTFKDRLSQMITDALRGLWMEAMGYKTHIMEFISDAHTHRNVLIIGVRGGVSAGLAAQRRAEALALEALWHHSPAPACAAGERSRSGAERRKRSRVNPLT